MKARLEGDSMSCEMLEILFPTDPKVDQDDKGFFFTSPALEDAEENGPPWAADTAELLLSHMNGIARIRSTGFRGLKIVGYEGVPVRWRLTGVSGTAWDRNGNHGLEPESARREMLLASASFRVARVLRLLGYPGDRTNWFDLYKIFETVEADLKSSRNRRDRKVFGTWIGQADQKAFRDSANSAEISGDGARHAEGTAYPVRSMTLREGRDLIVGCVQQWLAWKASS